MTFNKFINCETLDSFNSNLELGIITDSSIVFIEESKQIYTHGRFYSCPYTKEELDNLISSKSVTKSDIEKVLTGNITSHTHDQYLTEESDPTVPSWAKASSKPSYSYSEITNTPTSLKNPTSITIQGNGTSLGSYDGSEAKTINLTYSNIGAAAASHTHTKSQITDFPSTLPNPSSLVLKLNSGTTEGTNLYTYSGSASKTLDIKSGSNVSFSIAAGSLTISSTNTTYSAGAGLSLSGTTFSLGTSGVTAGSYGPTANVSGSNGTTINVPQITVDTYGRVTSVTNRVYTSVDTNTTYTLGSFGVTASATELNYCKGVTSAIQTQLNGKAASSHTHSYLPLSGGTMTGNITYSAKGTSYIGNGATDAANGVGGALNNLVISSWNGISFTTSCPNLTYTNKTAVGINCRTGQVYAAGFTGALNGNASTATTLQNARTINGTSFNGSANITTANWGTARTITIGSTGKSVNGSGNVSWSLSEIGAAAASHNHNSSYVSALGTSGNYLTWTKNGTTNNITVPYASNADTVDGYHHTAFSMGWTTSTKYRVDRWGGSTDKNWKKIVTYVNTGGGQYQSCKVKGTIYYITGNHNQAQVVDIPFEAIMHAYDGTANSILNQSTLYLPSYCTWDLIRIVRYANNSWEVQVRQPSDWTSISLEYTVTNNGGSVSAGQFSNTSYSSTVANNYNTNVTRPTSDRSYYSDSAGYVSRDRGQNTVTTLASLPITKSTVIANLSAATNISLASNMNVGESITVICTPSKSFTQPIPTSGSFISMDGSSLSVTSGKKFEINIYCIASGTYSISCKVAK